MKRLLSLVKDPMIKVKSSISDFASPQRVWLAIDREAKILINKKEVQKSDALFSLHSKTYYSPISGQIKNIVPRKNSEKEEQLYLQIINDYQEKDHYSGGDFTTTIIEPTLQKKIINYDGYSWEGLKQKKVMILNGIEDEIYLANRPFLHKYYKDEILLMFDQIAHAFQINELLICVKENDRESIEAFQSVLNMYPNMKLQILPDVYPIGKEIMLLDYLHLKEEAMVFYSEEIFDLYYEIVKGRRKDFILVTMTGDAILNPQVIRVKIGTELKEVVQELLHFKTDDYVIYQNGLMQGTKKKLEEVILDESVRAVYFMKKVVYKEKACERCGLCNIVCPVKANPYQVVQSHGTKKNSKCIHCGLCTFICPSHIPLEKYLEGDVK